MVARVEFHFGELSPRVGFIVANRRRQAVRWFACKRGTAEQWIKEGKQAVKMTRLSCNRFRSNQERLGLLAYNLGNLWRRLVLPQRIEKLVAHEFTATADEDRRPIGQARSILLTFVGRKPADAAAVWKHAAADRRAIVSGGIAEAVARKSIQSQEGTQGCLTRLDEIPLGTSLGTRVGAHRTPLPSLGPRQTK